MSLKLPALPLDKRRLAMAKARFGAWWNGQDFDEAAALAALEAAGDEAVAPAREPEAKPTAGDLDLFDLAPPTDDVRLDALQRIWGDGRLTPGEDAVDGLAPTLIGAPATGVLAVVGPGLTAPVAAVALGHPGQLAVYEWREETKETLKRGLASLGVEKRSKLTFIDVETFTAPAGAWDGLVSFDEFSYADNAPRFALQCFKGLKPGSMAVFECYCGAPGPDAAAAFASAFAEPHLRLPQDVIDALEGVGFRVQENEDITEQHLEQSRAGFRRLAARLKDAAGMDPGVARELAWESQAWRVRVRLLTERRMERRRFLARRTA